MNLQPASMLIQWHITDRCNLRCLHCYQEGTVAPDPSYADLMHALGKFKEWLQYLKDRRQSKFPAHITVTGGEPFLRNDFFDLLEAFAAHRRLFTFAILTNGTFIDAVAARRLKALRPRFVQVSIEGTPATHDAVRGSGNHERVVRAIRALVASHVPTFISFTAHRNNYREFRDVAALGRKLNVNRVWADRLIPQGEGACLKESVLDPNETKDLFESMKEARRKGLLHRKTDIAMHRALQFLVAGGRPYRCTAGDRLITVMPNGDVYPCQRMPIKIGNCFEESLISLYDDSALLKSLRNKQHVPSGCEKCFYAEHCGGGLRCLSHAMTGDPFRADPGCWLADRANIQL